MLRSHDVVVTGVATFKGDAPSAAELVADGVDARTLRQVSSSDAIGLAALARCARSAQHATSEFAPERVGVFVGAPPPPAALAEDYRDALRAALGPDGDCDVVAFGRASRRLRPKTLLAGLPNNVLCYGSIMLRALGPHGNYVSGRLSGLTALVQAAHRLERDQLDFAFAGAFETADASPRPARAFFLALERRASAERRGIAPQWVFLAGALGVAQETLVNAHAHATRESVGVEMRAAAADARETAGLWELEQGSSAATCVEVTTPAGGRVAVLIRTGDFA